MSKRAGAYLFVHCLIFKYCYPTLIFLFIDSFKYFYQILTILSNINHLLAHGLNGFNNCYLSAVDPQSSSSSTFKKYMFGYLFATKAILRLLTRQSYRY